jgi:hypothetical protein
MNTTQTDDIETPVVPDFPKFVKGKPLAHVCLYRQSEQGLMEYRHIFVTRVAGKGKQIYVDTANGNDSSNLTPLSTARIETDSEHKAKYPVALKNEVIDKFDSELNKLVRDKYRIISCEWFSTNLNTIVHEIVNHCKASVTDPGAVFCHVRLAKSGEGVQKTTPKPTRKVTKRLSKEDWLKQNYPGMTELPKWRFPSIAG